MWKRIFILIILILAGLAFNTVVYAYLPKADLIKGSGPEVYILENGTKYWIPTIEIFNEFRFKWQNIKTYSNAIIESYPQDDDWSRYDDYPNGSLLKGSGPEVYLIELGEKRWIPSPAVFNKNNFGWKYILKVDDEDLDDYDTGNNVTFNEPNRYPDTIILEGPENGTILESAEVTFKYSGTNPLGLKSDLDFETYLNGYDTRWRNQSSDTETYRLSEENKKYTFYVRAKNEEGYVDFSPVSRSFQIGVSPYYQKVEIRNVYADEDDFEDDYLILRNKEDQLINITDWTIKTKRDTITIPRAVRGLRHPFLSNYNSNIELGYGGELIISSNLSSQGVDFQINKCTGYLDQSSQFYPSLDEDCPYLNESEYSHLKSTCRDFINDLDRCELPDYSDDFAVSSDSECTSFLTEKFNYNQCYLDYYQEVDFFENEWRVSLSKSIDIFDNVSDTIILYDENGLKVDEYFYD